MKLTGGNITGVSRRLVGWKVGCAVHLLVTEMLCLKLQEVPELCPFFRNSYNYIRILISCEKV